jgi:hypothetical protein
LLTIKGEDKKPQLWVGCSLKHFGINTYSEPLFRVVWAPSRMRLIGGKHTERDSKPLSDRELKAAGGHDNSIVREWVGYRWYPMYPRKQCYVLEKWLSPFEYGGTKKTYEMQQTDAETGLLVSGPYPERGEYFLSHEFPEGYPASSAVESVIQMVLYGRKYTLEEKRQAMIEADKRERLALKKRNTDIILDSMPAFGLNSASTNPGRRKPEDYKLRYSAEDLQNKLGFPIGNNKLFTKTKIEEVRR